MLLIQLIGFLAFQFSPSIAFEPVAVGKPYMHANDGRRVSVQIMRSSQNIYPLYTGRLFHCDMLDESNCPFRGVRSILSHLFKF